MVEDYEVADRYRCSSEVLTQDVKDLVARQTFDSTLDRSILARDIECLLREKIEHILENPIRARQVLQTPSSSPSAAIQRFPSLEGGFIDVAAEGIMLEHQPSNPGPSDPDPSSENFSTSRAMESFGTQIHSQGALGGFEDTAPPRAYPNPRGSVINPGS